nr:transposase [Lactobacillus johnsonii]
MLINWSAPRHVYIVCGKTDLRKGIDGLDLIVEENYGLQLGNDSLFLFCGSRTDRFKGLYWMVKDSSYCISGLKMVICVGHGIVTMPLA